MRTLVRVVAVSATVAACLAAAYGTALALVALFTWTYVSIGLWFLLPLLLGLGWVAHIEQRRYSGRSR
jgi:hypothetical protein